MKEPLISIIIPTHNRQNYAISAIKSIGNLDAAIEVVVSDTSESDQLARELRGIPLISKLVLHRPSTQLDVVQNFQAALDMATGKFLTFIGDDDFVTKDMIGIALWAEQNSVDCISFTFPTQYYWPDFRHRFAQAKLSGQVRTKGFDGIIRNYDPRATATAALSEFCCGPLEMPRIYAGVVSRRLIRIIQQKHGQLFGGVSPDVYSAFLISQEAKSCVRINFPVIIPGSSGRSTSGQSANGKHVGPLRDNDHIRPFRNLVWDPLIPKFYSVETVWSYSLLRAAQLVDVPPKQCNLARLYIKCLLYYPIYWAETYNAIKHYIATTSKWLAASSFFRAICDESAWFAQKILQKVMQKCGWCIHKIVLADVRDTEMASKVLEAYLESSSSSIQYPIMN